MKFNSSALRTAASLVILSVLMYGCGVKEEISKTRDAGLDALNDGIQKMGLESSQWRNVLEETREKLIQAGQSTLANEVSNVASRAASDAGIEAKCYTDFLRDRTKEELIKIRASITKEQLELRPVFCNPTPNSVDMNLSPERRPTIEIAGYNLTPQAMKVALLENDGKKDITAHLSNPSGYLLTLNLGSNGVPLSPKSNQILFELPNGETKTISVVQPAPPPPKPEYLSRDIRVVGRISLSDIENIGSNENKVVDINQVVKVNANGGGEFYWEDCVGGEVQGYMSAKLQLDRNTGKVTVNGLSEYHEGTKCGRTDSQGNRPVNFEIPLETHYTYEANMADSDGHVIINLNFSNR